jgi:hypothetical protein
MNDTFSSRDLVANVERSRKLSVEIGRELKNGCEGRVLGAGLDWGCRVMRSRSSADKGGCEMIQQ